MRSCASSYSSTTDPVNKHAEVLIKTTNRQELRLLFMEISRLTDLGMCGPGERTPYADVIKKIAADLSQPVNGSKFPAKARAALLSLVVRKQHEGPPDRFMACLLNCDELSDRVRERMRRAWLNGKKSHRPVCAF